MSETQEALLCQREGCDNILGEGRVGRKWCSSACAQASYRERMSQKEGKDVEGTPAFITQDISNGANGEPPVKRRRGRPKGSHNAYRPSVEQVVRENTPQQGLTIVKEPENNRPVVTDYNQKLVEAFSEVYAALLVTSMLLQNGQVGLAQNHLRTIIGKAETFFGTTA